MVAVNTLCLSAQDSKKIPPCGRDIQLLHCIEVSMNFVADDKQMQSVLLFLMPVIIITFKYAHTWITTKQCELKREGDMLGIVVFFL